MIASVAALLWAAPAGAAIGDPDALLAAKFAPQIRLVNEPPSCGEGDPYLPVNVDGLFDQPTVALRGPWGGSNLVKVGPAAGDLAGDLFDYHLDFPGNALDPGCTYLDWSRRLTAARPPAVYAHVTTDPDHPGQLVLQYWMFYVYNDWNNLHEGDWEMIQLDFAADDARQALAGRPQAVGYSQHEGAERADWGDDKLDLVDGTHPVVYPAAGSHANFFREGLFLGRSAEQGVGCDNTTGPHRDLRPAVATIPGDAGQALAAYPWIGFQGRWGELQPAFYNGPTGPNLKAQWTEPIKWSDGWRDRSFTVPTGSLFGTSATDFFCRAIGTGSRALVRLVNRPLEFALILATLAVLLLYAISRTSWRPLAPFRLARRRAWGQTLAASARMYIGNLPLVLGIGVLFIPVSLVVSLLQTLVLHGTSVLGVQTGDESSGVLAFFVVAIGTALTLLGLGFVQAATAQALVELDRGRAIGPLKAYRLASDSVRPLLGALFVAVVVVSLLASSLYLIPIAIWLAARWALIAPAIELEDQTAIGGLGRSSRLVRGKWLKVASLVVVGALLAIVAGPLIGVLLILVTDAPFWLVNVVAGVVYVLTMPLVAIATTYVYFDRRVDDELAGERQPSVLPAEIELSS